MSVLEQSTAVRSTAVRAWTVLPTRTSNWVEIDTPSDLALADDLLVG